MGTRRSRLLQIWRLTIDSVKPTNYFLSVYELQSTNPWQYQGRVKIALEIKKAAKEIVLNTHQLKIHSAELSTEHTKTELASKASNISYHSDTQRATLAFDDTFPVSSKAWLDIKFEGTINNVRIRVVLWVEVLTPCFSTWLASTVPDTSQQ